jgi:uncharacterized membrane protein YkvA (DUF1232 family)
VLIAVGSAFDLVVRPRDDVEDLYPDGFLDECAVTSVVIDFIVQTESEQVRPDAAASSFARNRSS